MRKLAIMVATAALMAAPAFASSTESGSSTMTFNGGFTSTNSSESFQGGDIAGAFSHVGDNASGGKVVTGTFGSGGFEATGNGYGSGTMSISATGSAYGNDPNSPSATQDFTRF
jgi:type 1 fimbria pilin